MNYEAPQSPREELEAKLTALLLGELPDDEAAALREIIEHDAALARLHERLSRTIALVRETAVTSEQQSAAPPAPLKLSDQRRQKLLQHFKTVAPKEFERPRRSTMVRLLEWGVAAALVAIVGALLLPALARSKARAQRFSLASNPAGESGRGAVATTTAQQDVAPTANEALGDALKLAQETPPQEFARRYGTQSETLAESAGSRSPPATPGMAEPSKPTQTTIFLPSAGTVADAPVPLMDAPAASTPLGAFPQPAQTPNSVSADGTGQTFGLSGEPAWTGSLEKSEPAHSDSNRFIGSYAYNVPSTPLQSGGLDAENLHNYGRTLTPQEPASATAVASAQHRQPDDVLSREKQGRGYQVQQQSQTLTQQIIDPATGLAVPLGGKLATPAGDIDPATGLPVPNANLRDKATTGNLLLTGITSIDASDRRALDSLKGVPSSELAVHNGRQSGAASGGIILPLAAPAAGFAGGGGGGGGVGGAGINYFASNTESESLRKEFPLGLQAAQSQVAANDGLSVSPLQKDHVPTVTNAVNWSFDTGASSLDVAKLGESEKVPVLGDLPLLGALSKSKVPDAEGKKETLNVVGYVNVPMGTNYFTGIGAINNQPAAGVDHGSKDETFDPGASGSRKYPAKGTIPDASFTIDPETRRVVVAQRATPFVMQVSTNATSADESATNGTVPVVAHSPIVLPPMPSEAGTELAYYSAGPQAPAAAREPPQLAANSEPSQGSQPNREPKRKFEDLIAQGVISRAAASGDLSSASDELIPASAIDFRGADLNQVLSIYGELMGRTVVRQTDLPAQHIVLKTEAPITKRQAIQALDAVLGLNGIGMIKVGDKYVKAVTLAQAQGEGAASSRANVEQLTDSGQYEIQVVKLQHAKPSEILPSLVPMSTISNSIVAIDESRMLVLRDKPEAVKRLLEEIRNKDSAKVESEPAAESKPKRSASKPADEPQPEVQTADQTFSTFSLNVSDVSFKLAGVSLEKGVMPEPGSVRSEEFINAFDYRDPEPPPGVPVAFAWERARYPYAQNRDLLRFSIKTAAEGREPGRPLNIVLLLDTSGSMERADRVSIIREALRVLAAQLQPQDKFSVVTFARTARLWVDGVPGNEAARVADEVGGITPQGGTNLEEAMNLAYQTALRHYLAGGVNRVVLLTDGAANLGNVEPDALKQKVEAHRKQGIALDCFGIGWEGYNDDLLEVLSRNGDGRYGFINTPEEAASGFAGQLAGALHVAASDVKVQVEFNPRRVTAWRQIGYAKHQLTKEQFRDNTVAAAQIGAAESGNALYVIAVNPLGEGPLGTVRVRYKVPATGEIHEHEWAVAYTGNAAPLEEATPAMRLAATASAFSEWLAASPFAADVSPDSLLGYLHGVPEICGADARPKKLEWMIRQAKSIEGK